MVWPPFASRSATHLLRIELIRLLIVACLMLVHSSSMAVQSCWILAGTGTRCCIFRSRASQICSMGDMSGHRTELSCFQLPGIVYRSLQQYIYIYIYAFSRRFYPKRLTFHSSFYILSALAFPGNRTHDLGIASAMLYQLSYRKAHFIIKYSCTVHYHAATWDDGRG